MTTWMDWRSWTYFIIGNDLASSGRIVELDFPARKIAYLRETGRSYDTNPHPLGTPEYEAYLYDTVEAHFDHVWVNPLKSVVLSREDYECLIVQHRKPPSFVELFDVHPRDFFAGDVVITSMKPGMPSNFFEPAGSSDEAASGD
jgi:hypothetical protein